MVGGVRLFFRALLNTTRLARTQVLIYGAGSSGRQLQVALLQGNEFSQLPLWMMIQPSKDALFRDVPYTIVLSSPP